jgi:hypothetical protein
MAEFSWAYIDSAAIVSASGPTGSIQYRVADSGGNTAVSGSSNFIFHTASNLLAITGSVEISGTLTANQYNVNVIDKTVTNISASGDTIFGDTADDTHQFTGSMFINGPLSASTNISASAFYGDGSTLTGISATSISGAMGQFNTTSGLLITSGNAYLGDGASDITTVASQLTASQGALFNEQVMIVDDKNLVFGSQGDSIIKYDEAGSDALVISGSSTGLWLGGGSVTIDSPLIQITGSTIISGTLTTTDDINLLDDKKLNLGNSADALIEYDTNINKLAISGSATGIELMGGSISMDYPGGTVVSGTAAGAGSFLALNSSHQVVVATPAGGGSTFPYTGNAVISGTLDVSGSISRHGFLQLGINAEQSASIANLNTVTPSGSAFPVSWNDVVRKDTAFYSHVGSIVTLIEAGDYKITYSANFSQMLPDNARSNMKTYLEKSPQGGLGFAELPYSHAYCYLRGSGDTSWGGDGTAGTTRFGTNTATTIITGTAANDELRLQFLTIGGINYGAWDMRLPAYETWITIEKI